MSEYLAIDAMGGDNAPGEIVKGIVSALPSSAVNFYMVGAEDVIKNELSKYSYDKNRIEIVNATEVIGNDEAPTTAIKKKKNSSVVVGLNLLKQDKACGFISAGSTGAILTGATVIVGRLQGIDRPALAALLPNSKGFSLLIDIGANVDAKPEYLVQFAKMGSIYLENVLGKNNPSVGLLNIGAEKEKGNALSKEAYVLLEQTDLNFYGNVEPREIPFGAVDVVVCDAFVGNTVLKYSEGFAKALMGMLKEELMSSALSKLGAVLSKGAFSNLKERFDYEDVGGAPFLGLNKLVVKAHGSSGSRAIQGAVKQCELFMSKDVITKIKAKLIPK